MASTYVCAICGDPVTLGRHKSGWRHLSRGHRDHQAVQIARRAFVEAASKTKRGISDAISAAELILPGSAAADGEIDARWQAVIDVSEFIESEPEAVWLFARKWGAHSDADLRAAIATCVLEHLLEHHFDMFIARVEDAAATDQFFAETVSHCWTFVAAENSDRADRFNRLKASIRPMTDLDALVAAPAQHTLLLENDKVRVLDTRIAPGDRTPLHTHRWPAVHHVISWSAFVRRDRQDVVLLDTRAAGVTAESGAVLWGEPLAAHTLENVGSTLLHIVSVEIKQE